MNWGLNRGPGRGAAASAHAGQRERAGGRVRRRRQGGRRGCADQHRGRRDAGRRFRRASRRAVRRDGAGPKQPPLRRRRRPRRRGRDSDNPYAKLGTNPLLRLWNYEVLEIGKSSAPVDPTAPPAPPSVRDGWTPPPQTNPPMPFTDWPYGGTTALGDNRTASVDSPLMVAIANTDLGKLMKDAGIQAYGWVDYGGNISTSKKKYGNAPAAYDYNPNDIQLDQAVLYVERTPDTVQTDHIDWGFRVSAIYGENYRYTTSYGLASYQLLKDNKFMGYDFPMVYGEVYIPQVAQGMMIRVGRYISVPDIEAQLAPNNYMYSHSIGYSFDNYTNEGIQTTIAITKQFMVQVGLNVGTESTIWHAGETVTNLFPNNPANLAQINKALGTNLTNANPLYPNRPITKIPARRRPGLSACAINQRAGTTT